ncbi:Hypothetical predicted protein [Podarcis lilfordi]|uniref:Ig-like domain-containing protein n=1 Tax=Podarcis lilfordi TaxID=74358 RepID=A0AA35PTA1_9SAUR|nr:Hypothetical predicted protein [Podarcis lilfordi]
MAGPRGGRRLAVLLLAALLRARGLLCAAAAPSGELRSPLLICRVDNNSIQVFCMPGFQHPPVTYHWELKNTFLSDQPVVSIKGSLNPSEQITCTITTANSNASTSISVQKCYLSGITANGRNRRITRVLFIICVIVMVVVSWFLLYRKSLAAER